MFPRPFWGNGHLRDNVLDLFHKRLLDEGCDEGALADTIYPLWLRRESFWGAIEADRWHHDYYDDDYDNDYHSRTISQEEDSDFLAVVVIATAGSVAR